MPWKALISSKESQGKCPSRVCVEGSGDDEELDPILEDLLKEEESSGVTTEEPAETSSEDESEEKEKTKEAEKDDSAATSRKTTPSTKRTKDKDFAEEEDDGEDEAEVIPLEGIKTILVVTKNTSKSDAGEKEPSERISEAELNSDIVLVNNEMEVK